MKTKYHDNQINNKIGNKVSRCDYLRTNLLCGGSLYSQCAWRASLLPKRYMCVLLVLLICCMTVKAQLSDGKVYCFENIENAGQSMTSRTSGNYLTIATTAVDDYAQLWYADEVDTDVYTLRNLGNGRYLRSPNATGNANWTCVKEVEDNAKFTCSEVDDNDVLRASNSADDSHYLHYGSGTGTIVCWSATDASQWKFTEVSVSDADLEANWARLAVITPDAATVATYQTYLDNLFSDKSCTTPKKSLTTEDAIKADPDYQALPEGLQNMVLKVYLGSWDENNCDDTKSAWGASYAKKYRVQLYEPYNEPGAAATALGLNAHTNMNNPTGIFANSGEALYVMVEGAIEEGASLYIASVAGHNKLGNDYADGEELHEGLNVIPSFIDGNNYYINYVVHTFDTSDGKRGHQAKARQLSAYDDLKIHIEGGYINGYYNKMGDALYLGSDGEQGDTDTDWEYIEARATQTDVTVLGEYITLQFPLNDADTEGNKGMSYYLNEYASIEDVIDEWDKVMVWERLVLGVLSKKVTEAEAKKSPYSDKDYVFEYTGDDAEYPSDYGDYYNVHGLAFGVGGDAYMYGGWDHCGYHYNTMGGVIQNLPTDAGSHWGPGHEIGHQHQALLTVNGLTEVTNNLFSNVVLWYYGETTSRYNGSSGSLTNVLEQYNTEGADFFSNNIWALTHMYYKLFLYYHVLGHNPKFYPTLFEMLRQDPMSGGYYQQGSTTLLHFYKKCCLASGDDLTEFFRAHGFFEVMDNRLVGDYGNSEYTQTQDDIDAAIAEVKDWGYEENLSVLFINDATGETIKSHKGNDLAFYGESAVCAEVGSYASFSEEMAADYTYSVSGSTITMEGTGGVGFAVYNAEGELIAFSDTKTFEISDECAALIASGEAELKVVNADNTVAVPVDVMDTDDSEAKYVTLGEMLEEVEKILALSDDTGKTCPGFYKGDAVANLRSLYAAASEVYTDKTIASYTSAYESLYQEYINVLMLGTDKVPFLSGSTYVLTNKLHSGKSMAINADNALVGTATDLTAAAQQWTFVPTGTADTYYLKNVSSQKYLGSLAKSTQASATAGTVDDASSYKLFDLGNGLWALQCQSDGDEQFSLHCDGSSNVVGWYHTASDNDGSWWYLTATNVVETDLPRYELEDLVAKTEALMAEVAVVQYKGDIDLGSCNVASNATEPGHGIELLYDSNPNTYFHTVWKDSEVAEKHYIQVDLGEGKSLTEFVWTYTTYTTQWAEDFPKAVVITGSNDAELWTDIKTLSDLPTVSNTKYSSETLGSSDAAYRYLRFTVTSTTSGGKFNDQYYFGLAEFGLNRVSTQVVQYAEFSSYITSEEIVTAYEELLTAQDVLSTEQDCAAAIAGLQEQYNILLDAYNKAKSAAIDAKKAELQTLIDNTTSLIASCGSVAYTTASALILSADSGDGVNYLSGGPSAPSEGSIVNLLDGDVDSYYVSNWNAQSASPYLQVRLPDGQELNRFTFTFTSRNSGNAPTPTTIVVSGSNDGNDFTEIDTFTKTADGFPEAANNGTDKAVKWTSPEIVTATACKYLRFTVTTSERSSGGETDGNGFYHFGISEFGLSTVDGYVVELDANFGSIAEELMIAVFAEKTSAQATLDIAMTEIQLQNAIDRLQADYQALSDAKAYYTLYNYYTDDVKLATGNIEGSDAVGYISATLAEEYNTAYSNATTVLGSNTATDEDYTNAYNALVAANEALVVNMPEEGKYYALQCALSSGYATEALAYASPSDNKMYWATDKTTADATAIWTFTPSETKGKFVVSNMHTGTGINGFGSHVASPLVEGGADVSIEPLSGDGQVGILCNGTMMHAQSDYKAVVHWPDVANSASAWRIVEVEDMSQVKFSLTVGQYLHAGLYLNYPVAIPDGLKAYIIDASAIDIDADGVGTLKLTALEGTVMPAGYGYILDAPQGSYAFYYTADEPTDDVSGNMLGGSAYVSYREAETDHNYYVFGQKSGVVGLYKNAVKYDVSGAEGTTHYKVSANKVLFDWDNASSQVASFRFAKEGATTEIADVVTDGEQVVYDLYGRRIAKIVDAGLYIVNGTKMYIEVK